jgi:hypothetical protein
MRECMDWMIEHDLLSAEDKERLDNMDDDMNCMLNCMLDINLKPGRDCGPGSLEKEGCKECSGKCFADMRKERGLAEGVPEICLDRNYDKDECVSFCESNPSDCGREQNMNYGEGPSDIDDDHKCMAECMIESGLIPGEDCGEGDSNPDCSACGDKCFDTQESNIDKTENNDLPDDERCMAECMIDAGLIPGEDSSGPEYDSCIDQCFEKPEEPEPRDQEDDSSSDIGSEEDVSGETDSSDSGEGDSDVTGEVIREGKGLGLFEKLNRFIKNLFK